ncbi:MAG: glycoside hydrolase family 3 N-terminal domain-containing protein [Saprospiraceae bacterium]
MKLIPLPRFTALQIVLLLLVAGTSAISAQVTQTRSKLPSSQQWVEQQLAAMSAQERIGQLFIARAHSDGSGESLSALTKLVNDNHIGGLCFFSGTPEAQVKWTNVLQRASAKTPLLVSMDAEWGAAMRFKEDAPRFPFSITLGAANDIELTRKIGRETGRELRRLGVHMSFAPVADLNSNPDNPVIGRRSFGENPIRVGRQAQAYARGLADSRVLAVAKHFPGHGDTNVDSHVDLPVLRFDESRLDSQELVPFQMLAQDRIAGIMTGHLVVPALDNRQHRPASLSAAITDGVLRKRWNYQGLIVSDGLDMEGLTKHFSPGEIAVEALLAGNDLLLVHADIPLAIAAINRAITRGKLTQERVDASVRRILQAKFKAGLETWTPLRETSVKSELFAPIVEDLNQEAYRKSTTVVRARTAGIPILRVDTTKTAVLSIGAMPTSAFQRAASKYAPITKLNIIQPLSTVEQSRWIDQLSSYELVLVGIHDMSWSSARDFGLLRSQLNVLRRLSPKTKVVLVLFGSPYALRMVQDFDNIIVAYENTDYAQKAAAELLYGAIAGFGSLPVSVGPSFPQGALIPTAYAFRLRFSTPGNAGFSESKLRKIDKLAAEAIRTKAAPGGTVFVAKDGQVGLLKSYGKHTYNSRSPVIDEESIYDLASITKVAATTLCLMRLHEQGAISVYDRLDKHLPWTKKTNKGALIIQDILSHRARLKPWIPFYHRTITETSDGKKAYLPSIYTNAVKGGYSLQVNEKLFIADRYRDTLYHLIGESELRTRSGYRYSDLGMYLLADLIKTKTGLSIAEYADREFYRPLGLRTMGYNPMARFDKDRIPPTEEDDYFRFGRVQGYVHDMGAAMLGGVSGHAGLFSDVVDLGTLMQMLLNEGYYGGRRYFKPETVRLFTTRHPKSTRRGLGFDMAELSSRGSTNMTPLASARTFGHLGFTGTCAWADPETGLVFVWLTNRTYPKMSPNKFGKENFRPRMQEAAYESLLK